MTKGKTGVPQVWEHYGGDRGYRILRAMTPSELAKRDADQHTYEAMLARQTAYMSERLAQVREASPSDVKGCVFAKSCKLPDSVIDYHNPTGYIPTEALREYGQFTLLGGRQADESGRIQLKSISGSLPASFGTFALGRTMPVSLGAAAAVSAPVAAGVLIGLVGLLMPTNLGDGSLYTEEQLRSLEQARTRVRLHVETQVDGTLKGYGYNTQTRRDWEMIPVVTFQARGEQQVADFGDGVELIWTPAVDPSATLGIPTLEAAPQAPHIWIFPPTPAADSIIVNPIYPPQYKDFILVFPADSGVSPLYIVLSISDHKYHPTPKGVIPAFPDLVRGRSKTPVQGGGGIRPHWHDRKGNIYEWDRQHGALEKYNPRGNHLGEFNHITGEQTKKADETRKVEP
ncbi:colicin E3/pyocin S6 family cytotoxin [Pseudomonas brassicacearum]|jgi:Cytotoxic./S-type Pyocin.|uniref:colicin E3/pyocin S6 family cytotoxin n=1 Tax=Pseudomonas brassicacearum TaxID=930166 RepID=UPI00025FF01E|nr:colicin E3/pyocin S6 family cytotoxin [Pseudomonas brassicacearum]EIK70117.1 S-type pyocin/colicin family protein [Pseudomonas fluorescens Q8r1-96]KAB0522832.1 toxin [Pseudomonas brassicacearum subsp. brassicacearum]NJP61219.1 toxin [Pseudomonas brassicacearum]QEO76312.1 toxin [Pseudomonas brassicacearum]SDP97489.1 S-type Pyocin [Pseudomonas brassicacearum]